ncbi:hypothetical protein [Lysinibacillus sphaericus]|uniref:hypothetical protein n=1 Tax=Lysinibacillus sphaericus TaxID=1421 RepID=UPI0025A084DA|nr:hypothetical protein [Lysinibacillus sphaericus]
MRITQHCIWNPKHHRNIKQSKRLLLPLTYYGSKPNKKKRTTRRLKPMIMQPFQGKRNDKMVMSINSLDVRPPVLIFLRYQQLRC